MKEMLERLNKITSKCREDMHEPDEQGLELATTGYRFDNAFSDDPNTNRGEFTIRLMNENSYEWEWFNLATLIALARKAKL